MTVGAVRKPALRVHVPYAISWVHERVSPESLANAHFHEIAHIRDLPALLNQLDRR